MLNRFFSQLTISTNILSKPFFREVSILEISESFNRGCGHPQQDILKKVFNLSFKEMENQNPEGSLIDSSVDFPIVSKFSIGNHSVLLLQKTGWWHKEDIFETVIDEAPIDLCFYNDGNPETFEEYTSLLLMKLKELDNN